MEKTDPRLARLKDAITGKGQTDQRVGGEHHVAYAEVSPADIVAVCDACPPSPRIKAMREGSSRARNDDAVYLRTADVAHLVEEAEKASESF